MSTIVMPRPTLSGPADLGSGEEGPRHEGNKTKVSCADLLDLILI